MTKEELKALGLTDDQVAKISDDYGKNYVAKSQFNQKLDELKHAKSEMEARNKELEDLKKNNKDNENLSKQLEDMKKAAKDREAEYQKNISQMQLDYAVENALSGAKAKNGKTVKALLNMENVKLDSDGKLIGLSEQLDAIKNSDGYLFEAQDAALKADGLHPGDSGAAPNDADNVASQFSKALNGF